MAVYVEMSVIDEAKSMIQKSGITQESDARWPSPNSIGRQELEVVIGDQHISFVTSKLHRLMDVHDSNDPDGLSAFYFLTGDLRWLIFTLIGVHFKIKPI
uniref:Uncharacterized protein n=1 Tax=Lotharella oceanica TaxID=641309 RepID=A0A7S2U040_9EUKA|mmetsp:Transcript_35077/g.64979  ORF Transcript_35077/g.64979 Transcript_35077/m.64979 type:complete len:100 (+) Transcript_35077:356-655(+)